MPVETVKPPVSVIASLPVVNVTLRAPEIAFGSIVIETVAEVGELTDTELTVMPAPNAAVVVPFTKWLNWPVTATVANVLP